MEKRNRRAHEDGFSLLEMIIAVTLVALMAVGVYAVFRISLSSWSRGTGFIDVNQRHRSILDLVQKQMASIYGQMAPIDLQSGGAIYPIFGGTEDSVQFISLSSLRFQENPGLTMVSYDLVRGSGGNFSLVEREQPYLGIDPLREGLLERKDDRFVTIFEDLASFTFEYFDSGTGELPAKWVREWNAREIGKLPAAISMTMVSRDSAGGLLSRHMVVPIMAKPYDPRLNFVNPFETRGRRMSENDPRFRQ